jgi:hypothetical protein
MSNGPENNGFDQENQGLFQVAIIDWLTGELSAGCRKLRAQRRQSAHPFNPSAN